ncbi:hypothetical protein ABK883_23930, partial [Enterobacter roggenkampii]|uniref:hypothetical protein n=1 Tax=Enterobacter roggenkampii TaxID=1812935 RepID=UPI00374ED8CF
FGFAENTDDLFVGKTLLHGDVLMWLMKTLLTSGCTNQRGAGQRQSEIKMPLTIKEKVILWVDTETHFIAFIIACIVAFLSFVPLVWLGLWRGVGIAVRSAKKEIKGNE